jgi:hypothetical protein
VVKDKFIFNGPLPVPRLRSGQEGEGVRWYVTNRKSPHSFSQREKVVKEKLLNKEKLG